MSTKNTEVIGDNGLNLLEELQTLLERQIKLVRQDNVRDVETLSEQADSIVDRIAQTGILDPADPAFNKVRREQLQKLYEKLCLAVTAQKADASEKIGQVRKGKKTIQAYRGHI